MTTAFHCYSTDYSSYCCSSSKLTTASAPTCCMVKERVGANIDINSTSGRWLIIGAPVGAFVLLCSLIVAVLVCVACCIYRRRRRGRAVQPVDTVTDGEREGNNSPTSYGTFNCDTPTSTSPYSHPRDALITVSQEEVSLSLHREVQVVSSEGDSSSEPVDTCESKPSQMESPLSTGATCSDGATSTVTDEAQVSIYSTMPALLICTISVSE